MSKYNAIHLVRSGSFAVVSIEVGGRWVELIREPFDAPFSHIIEPGGIEDRVREHAHEASVKDLAASGGIVGAP